MSICVVKVFNVYFRKNLFNFHSKSKSFLENGTIRKWYSILRSIKMNRTDATVERCRVIHVIHAIMKYVFKN
jgi:hypothetical protein